MIKGIIDRFEGNHAVILIEKYNQEIIVDKRDLPTGSKENTVLSLIKTDDDDGIGRFKINSIDTTSTISKAQKSSDLMSKLRSKNK